MTIYLHSASNTPDVIRDIERATGRTASLTGNVVVLTHSKAAATPDRPEWQGFWRNRDDIKG